MRVDPHGNERFQGDIVDAQTGEIKQSVMVSSRADLEATLALFPGCEFVEEK